MPLDDPQPTSPPRWVFTHDPPMALPRLLVGLLAPRSEASPSAWLSSHRLVCGGIKSLGEHDLYCA
jgi:hypothetical protein